LYLLLLLLLLLRVQLCACGVVHPRVHGGESSSRTRRKVRRRRRRAACGRGQVGRRAEAAALRKEEGAHRADGRCGLGALHGLHVPRHLLPLLLKRLDVWMVLKRMLLLHLWVGMLGVVSMLGVVELLLLVKLLLVKLLLLLLLLRIRGDYRRGCCVRGVARWCRQRLLGGQAVGVGVRMMLGVGVVLRVVVRVVVRVVLRMMRGCGGGTCLVAELLLMLLMLRWPIVLHRRRHRQRVG